MQICLSGASSARSVHVLADAIIAPDRLGSRLSAIEEFNHLLVVGTGIGHPPTPTHDDRLRGMLRALDQRQAGASYRDIAAILFGMNRVRRDWSEGDHLKNHVRRLIQRGEALVDGGYRRFLRAR